MNNHHFQNMDHQFSTAMFVEQPDRLKPDTQAVFWPFLGLDRFTNHLTSKSNNIQTILASTNHQVHWWGLNRRFVLFFYDSCVAEIWCWGPMASENGIFKFQRSTRPGKHIPKARNKYGPLKSLIYLLNMVDLSMMLARLPEGTMSFSNLGKFFWGVYDPWPWKIWTMGEKQQHSMEDFESQSKQICGRFFFFLSL